MSIIHYYGFRTVIELGTSLGLNTLYLSKGKTVELLLTFEGNPILAELAAKHFKYHTPKEIRMIQGDIDHTLTDQLKQIGKVDFVYLDANHTAEATWRYFNLLRSCLSGRSVLVFDDIYWSSGMTQAWKKISQLPHKKLCLDLYQVGILIYDEKAPEGYFRLAF